MTSLLIKCESVSSVESGFDHQKKLRVMLMDVDVEEIIENVADKDVSTILDCIHVDQIKKYLDEQS